MLKMRVQGLICGGVTLVHLRAAVGGDLQQAIAGAGPQHVDVERRRRERGDRAHAATGVTVEAYLPALVGTSQVWRVRSPLMAVQLWPPLVVFQTPAVA